MKHIIIFLTGAISTFFYGFFIGPSMETMFETIFLFTLAGLMLLSMSYAHFTVYLLDRDLLSLEALGKAFDNFWLDVTLCLLLTIIIAACWSIYAALFYALGQMLFFYATLLAQSEYLKKYAQETFNDEDLEI